MPRRLVIAAAVAFTCALPISLHAHRAWMLPSSTIVSGPGAWVTVDAAVSNDLFYFDHQPFRLQNLRVLAPDGTTLKAENLSTGRYRSTFDVRLPNPGTYKIASIADTAVASYDEGGRLKHFNGAWTDLEGSVPAGASGLAVQRTTTRIELFVTSGKPTQTVLAPTGDGLELVPQTHPNDLVNGEPATFALVLDGKPAANVRVDVVPGGIRYRDQPNEKHYTTDASGRFTVTFDEPGMYWMNASHQEGSSSGRRRGRGPGPEGPVQPGRRASYTATLEVLPQ